MRGPGGCGERGSRAGRDHGSASIQLALVTPVLGFLIVMIVFGGRLALARISFAQVAQAAARSASLERTDGAAYAAALSGAQSALASAGLACDAPPSVSVSGTVTHPTPGQAISVSVQCTLTLRDSWMPITTSRTLRATATSPVDPWRGS